MFALYRPRPGMVCTMEGSARKACNSYTVAVCDNLPVRYKRSPAGTHVRPNISNPDSGVRPVHQVPTVEKTIRDREPPACGMNTTVHTAVYLFFPFRTVTFSSSPEDTRLEKRFDPESGISDISGNVVFRTPFSRAFRNQ